MNEASSNVALIREQTRSVIQLVNTGIEPILRSSGLPPERFMRVLQNALIKNDDLRRCDRMSILYACMTAAQFGIEPDGSTGEGYLIPFKKGGNLLCQFVLGYKGLLKLARNSGVLEYVGCDAVAEGDVFHFRRGARPDLVHEPNIKVQRPRTRAELVAVYAVAILKGSSTPEFVVLSPADCDAIRDQTQAWRGALRRAKEYGKPIESIDTPWNTNYVAMCMKSALKRVCGLLPLSTSPRGLSLAKAIDLDGRVDRAKGEGIITLSAEGDVEGGEGPNTDTLDDEPRPAADTKGKLDQFAAAASGPPPGWTNDDEEEKLDPKADTPSQRPEPPTPPLPPPAIAVVSQEGVRHLLERAKTHGWTMRQILQYTRENLGCDTLDDLPAKKYEMALLVFNGPAPAGAKK